MSADERTGVAVFVKTPGLSPVKTRLAREIGADAAHEVYERSVMVCERLCMRAEEDARDGLRCYWAVGEASGVGDPRWSSMPAFHTGEGGLGTRLARVQDELLKRHRRAVLIGSDCPQMAPSALAREPTKEQAAVTVGPASDGGFYLFACGSAFPREAWESVEYSAPQTLSQLLEVLDTREPEILREETDIDDLASLACAEARLRRGTLNEQTDMADWLRSQPWWPDPARVRSGV